MYIKIIYSFLDIPDFLENRSKIAWRPSWIFENQNFNPPI